jgi:chemotaxis protein histidine kinase CheA
MTDTTPTPNARVTKEDVLAALGDTDPNKTNASALRAILGRGGNTTIQKLLEEIRAERAVPVAALDTAAAPPAPAALIDAVWTVAWTAAQAKTAGALAASQALQATTAAALAVAQADAAAAQLDADEAAQALAEAQAQAQESQAAHAAALEALQAQAEEAQQAAAQEFAEVRLELLKARQDAALERAEHAAAVAALRAEVDRLINQLADLRAAFGRSAPAAQG